MQSSGIRASLFAKEGCERRSDVYFFSQCGNGMLTRVALLELKPNETLPVDEMSQWLYNELHDKMNNPDGTAIINDLNKLSNGKNLEVSAVVAAFYTEVFDDHSPKFFRRDWPRRSSVRGLFHRRPLRVR